MKKFFVALTALGLATGAAQAAGMGGHERPDPVPGPVQARQTIQVKASDVMSAVELHRSNLSPDTILTVTSFPSSDAPTFGNDKH